VKRVVVEQFVLTRWTDKISAEGKSESQSAGMLGAIGGGVWFAIAWGILAAFVGTPTWWIYAWVALGGLVLAGAAADLFQARGRASGLSLRETILNLIRGWG